MRDSSATTPVGPGAGRRRSDRSDTGAGRLSRFGARPATGAVSWVSYSPCSPYSSSYRPVSSSRPRYSPILRIAPLMTVALRNSAPLSRGALVVIWTLLDPRPRTEDRRADADVCRARAHGVLQVGAHPGREPRRLGVLREEILPDRRQSLEGGPGSLPEGCHRHQPPQAQPGGLPDRG